MSGILVVVVGISMIKRPPPTQVWNHYDIDGNGYIEGNK